MKHKLTPEASFKTIARVIVNGVSPLFVNQTIQGIYLYLELTTNLWWFETV